MIAGVKVYKIAECLTEGEVGLGVIGIAPVWGDRLTAQEYYNYMKRRVEFSRRLILPGELGCALAHVEAYCRILDEGSGGVIFEEDVFFTKVQLDEISNVINNLERPDFINFSIYKHRFRKKKMRNNLYVADTSSGFWGASAYYLSPRMAVYLIEKQRNFIDIADNWQEVFIGGGFIPFYYPIFVHDGICTRIGDRSNVAQNPSFKEAIKLRWLRRKMTLLAGLRYFVSVRRARRMLIDCEHEI
jgi:hypothetical protein